MKRECGHFLRSNRMLDHQSEIIELHLKAIWSAEDQKSLEAMYGAARKNYTCTDTISAFNELEMAISILEENKCEIIHKDESIKHNREFIQRSIKDGGRIHLTISAIVHKDDLQIAVGNLKKSFADNGIELTINCYDGDSPGTAIITVLK